MYSHEPENYRCPICEIVAGIDQPHPWTQHTEVFYRTPIVTAFIGSKWWPNNPGHAIVVPNQHYENIYVLPAEVGMQVHEAARRVAIAFKVVYGCDGTSTRQHNEPAGNQDVWHYHMHVFPRYWDDRLYERMREFRIPDPAERQPYADRLRAYFEALE